MFRYRVILGLFVLTAASPVVAVDTLQVTSPDPVLGDWRWTTYDRSVGLIGSVRDITEDRDGNIWFGTERGAYRYDGLRWAHYATEGSPYANQIRAIIQDRDGAMWFGTRDGIHRFDPSTGSEETVWTTYTTDDSLAANRVEWKGLLQARDGTIWAGFWTPGDSFGTQSGMSMTAE